MSGAAFTLILATGITLAGIAYIHEGQRIEREVRACDLPGSATCMYS